MKRQSEVFVWARDDKQQISEMLWGRGSREGRTSWVCSQPQQGRIKALQSGGGGGGGAHLLNNDGDGGMNTLFSMSILK